MAGRNLIRQVGALLVVALCATACTDTDSADPPQSSTTVTPSETTTVRPGSRPSHPPITRPLSASPYFNETMICDLFSDVQAEQLGFDGFRIPSESEFSATCTRDTASGKRPHISLDTTYYSYDFLDGVYKGRPHDFGDWQPTVIVEQPAAIITARNGTPMACSVAIGISAEQGVEVEIFASDDAVQRCDLAVSIAETIVHNLGG